MLCPPEIEFHLGLPITAKIAFLGFCSHFNKPSHFPRNRQLHFAQYTCERPELTLGKVSGERKAKTTIGKLKMKRLNITFGTILLVLGCVAFSPVAKAQQPIVGLWDVHYTSACEPPVLPPEFFTYQQFHSDGLEIETPIFTPGVCMGSWKLTGNMVQIYHVGWTPGGIPGVPTSVRFVFTETLTVSLDRNSYNGTVDQTFYDAPVGGNVVAHCTATTHATRISVH
jgi:hypothetical protein